MSSPGTKKESAKLGAKRFGPFKILELVGKNAVRLELPDCARIHPTFHVEHTCPYRTQPDDICTLGGERPEPVIWEDGDVQCVLEAILSHRKRVQGFHFLTDMKGAPREEAEWQPVSDFVDADGTTTAVFLEYIKRNDLLRHLHCIDLAAVGNKA